MWWGSECWSRSRAEGTVDDVDEEGEEDQVYGSCDCCAGGIGLAGLFVAEVVRVLGLHFGRKCRFCCFLSHSVFDVIHFWVGILEDGFVVVHRSRMS